MEVQPYWVLGVHTAADGAVWRYRGGGPEPSSTGLPVARFVAAAALDGGLVRLVGSRANAPLAVALRRRWPQLAIELCSPTLAPEADPGRLLPALIQPELTQRLAGLRHRMTADDYRSYALLAALDDAVEPATVAALAAAHPAWPALSFVGATGPDNPVGRRSAYTLLATIVDPRWYRHPWRPHRLSRLHRHLGLTPENIRAVLTGRPGGRHAARAAAAVGVWYNAGTTTAAATGPPDAPARFLWRILEAQRTWVRGVLRATQRLVELVCRVWEGRIAEHREARFDPRLFFTAPECLAFERHLAEARVA